MLELKTDILVAGGGLGGVAAAIAALRRGRHVVLTDEFEWLGGQMTSQAVPPDEHRWIEHHGGTKMYRKLREDIRQYYRDHYPLTDRARANKTLNPGLGDVSALCHEPKVSVAVIEAILMPYEAGGKLVVLKPVKPVSAEVDGEKVTSVTFRSVDGKREIKVSAPYVVDATELGDLLPLTKTEYVTGFESRKDTGEPSAPDEAQPDNSQAVSICFVIDHQEGVDNTIPKPNNYDHWSKVQPSFWGAPLLSLTAPAPRTLQPVQREFSPNLRDDLRKKRGDQSLWTFRRIAARSNFHPGAYASDICLVNWPMIDYFEKPIIDCTPEEYEACMKDAADLAYGMLYWLQTEAPRYDGKGKGWPGLRLRGDITGTTHGLAMAPYIRESRRIKAVTTVVEQDLSEAIRGKKGAVHYRDSVGLGSYRIDLHPSTGGDNYLDVASCPFEIPLGALIPRSSPVNFLAACKNIGTTHITNGCYRLHPVEWNIGEAAGMLAAYCLENNLAPAQVQKEDELLAKFIVEVDNAGIERRWPEEVDSASLDAHSHFEQK